MALTDELRKTLNSATPLYVAAGTADLAAQKLRELPATLERLRAEAPERLPRLREQATNVALQGVGIALEYAVRARETYDGLAERGKTVVERRRGPAGEQEEQEEREEREETVTVERVAPVREPFTEPEEAKPASERKQAPAAEAKAEPKARAPRKASAPRRAPSKTAEKSADKSGADKSGADKSGADKSAEKRTPPTA
ncbi:hypothetical protein RM780_01160 [Streptomyces sp. DSM 44917]|uniref:Translation initiation factor IF-2 n=1 Tax=Streptomyces boetiae TaxID=3075541 RepID=A0ABU2L1Z4_9ACTN|nr:hypothetical protein [Streptomyces sp. DSM 44917]MDT0305575.1 hypothetical protein [Streptomyces sp. DSM 44917]